MKINIIANSSALVRPRGQGLVIIRPSVLAQRKECLLARLAFQAQSVSKFTLPNAGEFLIAYKVVRLRQGILKIAFGMPRRSALDHSDHRLLYYDFTIGSTNLVHITHKEIWASESHLKRLSHR